ncbi:MAG: DUF721 domain-containing protein [Gammaproteobacteria bacterium]|nr:DUF721 domain-containing protein [Gammaproteobacteria bacterium]
MPVDRLTDAVLRLRPQLKTELQKLTKCVSIWPTILEQPLASHTHPMDWRDNQLYIGADSPVWAHSLRHRHSAVISTLRENGLSVEHLRVRVTSIPGHSTRTQVTRAQASTAVTQAVETTARSIQDDGLREALMRLSKTLRG